MLPRPFAVGLLAGAFLLAGRRPHAQQDGLRTRAEATGYTETSSYEDVRRIVAALAAQPAVHTTTFGQTEEGRELPLLVISEPR